jgi:hypothetical protein
MEHPPSTPTFGPQESKKVNLAEGFRAEFFVNKRLILGVSLYDLIGRSEA